MYYVCVSTAPVLYLSHGAPPLADDATWTGELHDWSAKLEKPKDILVVSAHWESVPATISSTTAHTPLIYDFWGFEDRYYQVTYDAPPATDLAQKVARAVGGSVRQDPDRGLDHGAYVPLVELFPEADVPVLQLSLPTLDPRKLYALGERLAELRDEGTLIVTSGFTTHNLRWFNPAAGPNGVAPTASSEFDHWAAEALANKDIEAILDFERTAPAAHEAHPRTEHWAPLYVALGAAAGTNHDNESVIDGFWYGLSKRSWQF